MRTLHRALSVTPFDFSLTCVLLLRCSEWICATRHSKTIKVYFSIIVALVTFLLILREIIWPKTSMYYGLSTFKTSTSTKYKSIHLLRSFALCVCICNYNSIRKCTQWTDNTIKKWPIATFQKLSQPWVLNDPINDWLWVLRVRRCSYWSSKRRNRLSKEVLWKHKSLLSQPKLQRPHGVSPHHWAIQQPF